MIEESKIYQLIKDYLNNNLTGAELKAFEKELQVNPVLKQKAKYQLMEKLREK